MAETQLTPAQLANAEQIIRIGKLRGMSDKDIQTALAVALAESNLKNYANSNVPDSLGIAHDAVGSDHKSVGVFQQQVGIWGSTPELMNLETSANKFFDALAALGSRDRMTVPQAAQAVQRSAFSDGSNYAAQLGTASKIMSGAAGSSGSYTTTTNTEQPKSVIAWLLDSGNQKRIGLFLLGALVLLFAVVKIVGSSDVGKAAVKIASKGLVK